MLWPKYIVLGCVIAANLQAAPLSLNEAIKQALRDSPVLAAEKEREKISDLEMRNRSNAFYPRLDLDSSHGVGSTNVAQTTDPWKSSAELKLTEKLYDNGESISKFRQGKLDREAARLSYEMVRDQLIYQITEKYYDYSKANFTYDAVNAQKEIVDKQYDSVSSKYRQGLKTKRDFLRFKAQAQSVQMDLRASENAKRRILLELKKLLGGEVEVLVQKPEAVQTEYNEKTPSLSDTYEIKIAKTVAEAKRYNVDLATRSYWPQINLVTGAYYRNDSYLNSGRPFRDTEGYGWSALVQLQYNLWDWGEKRREMEKAEAEQMIVSHEVRKKELEISTELDQLMNNLKDAKQNLQVSNELLKAQTEAHNVIQRDYTEGRAEYQDLTIDLKDLLDAKGRYYQARFDIATLIAKQKYYEGKIYESYKN